MERVFICYSREDKDFVGRLVADLKAAGVATWRDVDDIPKHIKASIEGWSVAVQDGLRLCTDMVVVVSPDSVVKPDVLAEWNYFLRHGKRVHPVFFRDCDMPFRLFALQWWDFRQGYDQPLAGLLGVLLRVTTITLPADLENAVNSEYPGLRQGAVPDLAHLIKKSNLAVAELALAALKKLAGDDVQSVSTAAQEELNRASLRDLIMNILPDPFEWCEIPEGQVKIKGQSFNVQPFLMAKYPITYEQYQVFIDDPQGFANPEWWEGLEVDNYHRKAPGIQSFADAQNLPRERVSWYDAMAFCRWLSSHVGYEVRLPTEWEWQWAAQGPDGRQYPWGPDFSQSRCNTEENGLAKTTPVGSYPEGASPYGVLDMAGNVWEWCLNEHRNPSKVDINGEKFRGVRGGSWNFRSGFARTTRRHGSRPTLRDLDLGFRVVRDVPDPS